MTTFVVCKLANYLNRTTLAQQGDPFTTKECRQFECFPFFNDAIRLRKLDERGKAEELNLPLLKEWLVWLEKTIAYTN